MLPVAILAGGLATRLGTLTEKSPKSLLLVAGKPFVVHQLELLRRNGIQQAILCVGHLGELIEHEIGDGREFGVSVRYSYDGSSLLGTAGALRKALPQLGKSWFVMYGDSYLPCDFARVEAKFFRIGKPALMTVFGNDARWDRSNVDFREGKILTYSKKERTPAMKFIDYGLGVFQSDALSTSRSADLADVYRELLAADQLAAMEVEERFYEIGSAAGLEETRQFLSNRVADTQEIKS